MNTSKQAYDQAQTQHVKAYNALVAARKALEEAEQAYFAASEELVKHESKPGIPLYAAQS